MSYQDAYDPEEGIAIIGLAGRFPGAADVDEFWRNLEAGRETIASFAPGELEPALGEEAPSRNDPAYVRARGILEGIDLFDAPFFGITPKEAEILDPQQRVFMEAAWDALENAGYDPRAFGGAIGVFAGMSNNTYFRENLAARADVTDLAGWLTTMMANEKDYLATRIAYKFDLRGPALNIQTACSTSLVAVCAAVQSLLTYQCDLALAGGVSITLPQRRGYLHQEGGITSPDGHCRTFDASAAGTVFSNGLGLVALRRLRDALADGDTIYAVIKGAGMNNDGSAKVSFTAPSVDGHAAVIALAQALAGIDPQTISYVEAHGTATPLGDPVEIAGLTQAFRAGGAAGTGFCAIGSVKSNVGHLDAAAGVAGLIKTALALHHKTLPASLHFQAPNPKLELECVALSRGDGARGLAAGSGLSAPRRRQLVRRRRHQRPRGARRGAAARRSRRRGQRRRTTAGALGALARSARRSRPGTSASISRAAATLRSPTPRSRCRRAAGASTTGARWWCAIAPTRCSSWRRRAEGGRNRERRRGPHGCLPVSRPGRADAVDGARAVRPRPGVSQPTSTSAPQVLRAALGFDLREVLYPAPAQEAAAAERLLQTRSRSRRCSSSSTRWRVRGSGWASSPTACSAIRSASTSPPRSPAVFTRDDALRLVAQRGQLMQALPPGAMLAVKAGAEAVAELLAAADGAGVEIAARNAPLLTVVSGTEDRSPPSRSARAVRGLAAKRLATSHAFHSAMMEPILETFTKLVAATPRSAPQLPWVSSLTGTWITTAEARIAGVLGRAAAPAGVVRHRRRDAPRRSTAGHARGRARPAAHGSRPPDGSRPRRRGIAGAFAPRGAPLGLWTAGVDLDWTAFQQGAARRRVPLPGYPFEHKRYWVEPGTQALPPAAAAFSQPEQHEEQQMTVTAVSAPARIDALVVRLQALFSDLSGIDAASLPPGTAFLELGLDSLFLTQAATLLQKTFGVKVTFRELLDELSTIGALAAHLDKLLPPDAAPAAPAHGGACSCGSASRGRRRGGDIRRCRRQRRGTPDRRPARVDAPTARDDARRRAGPGGGSTARGACATGGSAGARGDERAADRRTRCRLRPVPSTRQGSDGRPHRAPAAGPRRHHRALYEKTAGSKAATAKNRPHLADPRSVAGFRLMWKEIVYPIVDERSTGSRLWDVDGNEYVDLPNGFGMNFFGHNPDFVRDAVKAQLDQGFEIGPQSPLAGEVAELVCEHDRHGPRRASATPARKRSWRRCASRARSPAATRSRCSPAPTTASSTRCWCAPAGAALDAGRARHPGRHGRQRRGARLRQPEGAGVPEGARRGAGRACWSSRCRAAAPTCSRASSCTSCAGSPRPRARR